MEQESNPIEALAETVFGSKTVRSAAGFDHDLWLSFLESGLDQVLCTGEETSLVDCVAALRAAGRNGVAIPAAEAMLSRHLAARAGWEEDNAGLATIVTASDGWQSVPWGREAQIVYLVHEGRIARFRGPFEVAVRSQNVAGEPRDELIPPAAGPDISATSLFARELLARAALMKAAMMAGAMEGALAIVLDHAGQRIQFDRPISQFQAVQHMIAELAAHTAAVNAAVQLAAAEGSVLTAAIAKARASEAVAVVADAAHQVTGAMGFSAEFPLHRLTRRLWAWRDECGNERFWNRFVGRVVLSAGRRDGLWALISSADGLAAAGGDSETEQRT